MSTKHTATLPDGRKATRTSANRVYPYVIAVGPLSHEQQVADYEDAIARHKTERDRLIALADYLEQGGELVVSHRNEFGVDHDYVLATGMPNNGNSMSWYTHRGIGTLGWDYDGYTVDEVRTKVAARSREFAASSQQQADTIRERISTIEPDVWRADSWSSRPDLAAKAAEKVRARDRRREVRVLDTVRVTK